MRPSIQPNGIQFPIPQTPNPPTPQPTVIHFIWSLQVPMERRINRVTAAVFHFSSGAVGSLTHSLVLHTSYYQTGTPCPYSHPLELETNHSPVKGTLLLLQSTADVLHRCSVGQGVQCSPGWTCPCYQSCMQAACTCGSNYICVF